MIQIVKQSLKLQDRDDLLGSTLIEKLSHQKRNVPICAFTDIDDTLIRKSENVENHARYKRATRQVTEMLEKHSIPLIAVSGRDLPCVVRGQHSSENLPAFDMIGGSVGTEIWIRQKNGEYKKDDIYHQKIYKRTGFDREGIYQMLKQSKIDLQEKIPGLFLDFQLRDSEFNNLVYKYDSNAKLHNLTTEDAPQDYKISLEFHGSLLQVNYIKKYLKERLKEHKFEKVKVVVSRGDPIPDPKKSLYNIDILAASKGNALSYVKRLVQCKAIAAGDSGNDIDMLLNEADAGIVVGGSKLELLEAVAELPVKKLTSSINILVNKDNPVRRLLYTESASFKGPESLIRAFLPLLSYI